MVILSKKHLLFIKHGNDTEDLEEAKSYQENAKHPGQEDPVIPGRTRFQIMGHQFFLYVFILITPEQFIQ